MLYMSFVFGITIACEYIASLTNLTAANSPMPFPYPFQNYPCQNMPNDTMYTPNCSNLPETRFVFPWFIKNDFLFNNLDWAVFLSIDVEAF